MASKVRMVGQIWLRFAGTGKPYHTGELALAPRVISSSWGLVLDGHVSAGAEGVVLVYSPVLRVIEHLAQPWKEMEED